MPCGGRAAQRVGERGTCRDEDGVAWDGDEVCKLCSSLILVLTRPPVHEESAEAVELGLDAAAHGGGSARDIHAVGRKAGELVADADGEDSVAGDKKEGAARCGGNRTGGKCVRKVGARCDRHGELHSCCRCCRL